MQTIRGRARESWSRLNLQVALRNVHRRAPIIVYQMGKVGSSTVVDALHAARIPNPVLHVHTLVDEHLAVAKQQRRASLRPFLDEHLIVSSILVEQLSRNRFPCKLITLTREPVSRAISFVFQDWEKKAPHARRQCGGLDADAMQQAADALLRSGGSHADPTQWFDKELKRVFGLDVFSVPYDEERGYSMIRNADVSLLILRMEDMNRSLPAALGAFLGIDPARIVFDRSNDAGSKWYADAVKAVKDRLRMPQDILEGILTSRYMRHFYPNDIEKIRERWGM